MSNVRRRARVNVKALVILVLVVGLLGAGAVVGHYVRKRTTARRALAAGKEALEKQDWAEARKHLRLYLSKYPDDQEMLARYAEANLAIRPVEQEYIGAAIGAYRRLLPHRLGDAHICNELAKLYYRIADYSECAYVCRQRLDVDAGDAEAMLWLGRSLAAQAKDEEAADILASLVRKHPDQVKAYALLAGLAVRKESMSAAADARKWLDGAVEANPQSAEARAQRGRFFRLIEGNEASAQADLEGADALKPVDPAVLLVLAGEWMEWGEFDRAAREIELIEQADQAALDEHDADPDLLSLGKYMTAGRLALLRGDREGGVRVADQALKQLPDRHRGPFKPIAVELYVAGGGTETARAILEEYRDIAAMGADAGSPATDQIALLEALVADAEGRPYAVIDALETLAVDKPQAARVWRLLGRAYEETGQGRRALTAYEEYLKRSPRDREINRKLAGAYMGRNPPAALRYAVRGEQMSPEDLGAKLLRIEAQIDSAARESTNPERFLNLSSELASLRDAHPDVGRIRILQARTAAYEGRVDDAIAALETALVQCDEKPSIALEAVRYCRQLGRREQAVELCRTAMGLAPDSATLRVLLADLYAADEQEEDARNVLRDAAAELTGQEKLVAQVALAQFILTYGARAEGTALLRDIASQHPEKVQLSAALLKLPEVQRAPQEAQQLVDRLRGIEGERGLVWRVEQAKVWLRIDGWEQKQREIEDYLSNCIRSDPGWSEPVLVLGSMREMLHQENEAEEAYRMALASSPGQVDVIARLLALLERQNRFAEAEALLDGIPDDLPALRPHRIDVAIGLGDYESAIQELERRVASDPDNAPSRVTLARLVYAHAKDVDRAMEFLDAAEAVSPGLPAIAFTRASIFHAEGKDDEALSLINDEVVRRDDFTAYLMRAEFHAATGRFDLAENDYTHLATFADRAADGYVALGGFYLRLGRSDEAIAAVEAGLESQPEDVALQRMLVRALVAGGKPEALDRGRRMLDGLLARFPDDVNLLSLRAEVLLADDTAAATREATAVLERVIELDPHGVNAHLRLIDLFSRRGDLKKADEFAIRALGANPDSVELILARAGVEANLGKLRVARELAESVLESHPENVNARNFLSKLAIAAGEIDAARALNEEARRLNPTNEIAQVAHAEILEKEDRQDDAIQALESYRETPPGRQTVKTLLALADLYRGQGDVEAARARIDEAARLAPTDPIVFLARLRWLGTQGMYGEVLTKLAERRAFGPLGPQVLLSAASILASADAEEYLGEAKTLLEEVIKQEPTHVAAHLRLAQVAYRIDEVDAAEQAYRRILELEPDHWQALNDLAWILANDGSDDGVREAVALADKGLARHPDNIHLLDTRGLVLFKLGRLADARKDLEKCVELTEAHPSTRAKALLHLSRVLAQTEGGAAGARSALENARRIDEAHRVLSDDERAEIARLLESP